MLRLNFQDFCFNTERPTHCTRTGVPIVSFLLNLYTYLPTYYWLMDVKI